MELLEKDLMEKILLHVLKYLMSLGQVSWRAYAGSGLQPEPKRFGSIGDD